MKALAIRQKKLGQNHLACSDCLLNLGVLYKQIGFTAKAREVLDEALIIRCKRSDPKSLMTA